MQEQRQNWSCDIRKLKNRDHFDPAEIPKQCPNRIYVTDFGMRRCKQKACLHCAQRERNHWVPRLNAEAFLAGHTLLVTLTFEEQALATVGQLDPKEVFANYVDAVRRHMKRNKIDVKIRLLAVHEHGSANGRPHFHAILFFDEILPEKDWWFALGHSDDWPCWPHGYSQYEVPKSRGAAMAYVYDYLTQKDGQIVFRSNGLGKKYLLRWARESGYRGASPFNDYGFVYNVPGYTNRHGSVRMCYLEKGHSYIPELARAYVEAWEKRWGTKPPYREVYRLADYGAPEPFPSPAKKRRSRRA